MRVRSLVPMLVILAACAAPAPARAPAPAPAPAELAPLPYTAEQLRDATPVGRTIELRIEAEGKPTTTQTITFVRVGPEDADLVERVVENDQPPHEERTTVAWRELRMHAAFPRAATRIEDETVTVPAGTFACTRYVVTNGDAVKTLWFAKTQPGPPVHMTVVKAGRTVMDVTMTRSSAP